MHNVSTEDTIEYPSIYRCALDMGMSESKVSRLVKSSIRELDGDYLFRYKSDEPWKIDKVSKPRAKRILATHINGKSVTFPSLRATSKYFDVDRSVIKNCCNKDKHYKNWKMKYI